MVAPEMAKVTPAFGFGFRLKVVGRILAVVERPTFADEPTVDVFAARVAHGQQPGLSITAWPTQSTCRSSQVLLQPFRRELAARPLLSMGVAYLILLGRVDPFKAHVLASDDDRVAVDDTGTADDIGLRGDSVR